MLEETVGEALTYQRFLESPEEFSAQIGLSDDSSSDPISVYDLLFLFEVQGDNSSGGN